MKALTHYLFSAGGSFYLLSLTGLISVQSAILVMWLSFSVNYLIDVLGHSRGRTGAPSRTRLTHSVFTAPVWGGTIAFASIYVLQQTETLHDLSTTLVFWTTAGVLIAAGHLFLDSLTQAGVYYWKKRIAIAHFAYDNPFLNIGFAVAGVSLVGLSVFPGLVRLQ